MFKLITVEDEVRVHPKYFNLKLEDAIIESLRDEVEGRIDPNIGVFLAVTKVLSIGEGEILPEDPAIHYPATYEVLVYYPENQEVVLGEVVDISEFGAFVRIGPLDALAHVSQIMNDRIAYDPKNSVLTGRKSKRKLQIGDIVRARIVGVSLGKNRTKISLTMRQPWLGSLKWIEAEKRKLKQKEKGK